MPRFSTSHALGILLLATFCVGFESPSLSAADAPQFSRDILPILSDNCFLCHGPDAASRATELRLDLPDSALDAKFGAIRPGDAAASHIIKRVLSRDPDEQMPPPKMKRTLSAAQIDLLKRWIDAGATWGKHWAYEPLSDPTVEPSGRNPIDAFVAERLEREQLQPSEEADRRTLIRRATLDLSGLPPTPDEVQTFVADDAPDAYERVVDRLLASPAYGERMTWDWLDAARYADSNGYQGDGERTMWPWRDWAISAFNANQPFDEFTIWQLAGDQLPEPTFEQRLATGFQRNHMINGEGGRIADENRVDYVMDMAETTGTVWLGLTFNCCRCHNHKFDPLTQRDYYSLFAFFNQTPVDGGGGNPQTAPVLEVATDAQRTARADAWQKLVEASQRVKDDEATRFPNGAPPVVEGVDPIKLPDDIAKLLKQNPEQRDRNQIEKLIKQFGEANPEYRELLKQQKSERDRHDAAVRDIPLVMIMEDRKEPRRTFVLDKGLYNKPREEQVDAAVPASLPTMNASDAPNRLGLARWLVDARNPLTARVVVNRFWQQFFGMGLVKTAEDFGVQGEKPSHPQLLDWLAAEFQRTGWDVKRLCRLIVTSRTYRQTSNVSAELVSRDPENRLLARGSRFRLPAWMIRDQALAAAGLLSDRVGGKPVNPYQPSGIWEEATFGGKRYVQDHGESLYRRSIYTFWRRIAAPTMFFDSASRQTCKVKPVRTNTPLHALYTLNDVTFIEASRVLAERALQSSPSGDAAARIVFIFQRVVGRSPTDAERAILLGSLERRRAEFSADRGAAEKVLALGESKRDGTIDVVEHAATLMVVSTIFNLDETLNHE